MPLDAGDIVLVEFPFSDHRKTKRRPALVLTSQSYNQDALDFVAAFVTSKPQDGPWSLPVTDEELRTGSLVKPSWIRTDKIASIQQTMVAKTVATLNEPTRAAVRKRIYDLIVDPSRRTGG